LIDSGTVPLLVNVIVCAGLVVPSDCVINVTDAGATDAIGPQWPGLASAQKLSSVASATS